MSGIKAGNIYYTVGIDKASLTAVRRELEQFGRAASKAGGGMNKVTPELAKLATKATDLSNKMRTLNNDFKGGRNVDTYRDNVKKLGSEAEKLRTRIQSLSGNYDALSREQAVISGATAKLSGVMRQAADATGVVTSKSQRLGSEVRELRDAISIVNTKIRTMADELQNTGDMKAFETGVRASTTELTALKARLQELVATKNIDEQTTKELIQAQRSFSLTTRLLNTETTKATGKINQMAMAKRLSYGATTLLNDQIFQLSPALGILTNQLIFTTNGMRAFLASAIPIVAVAGSIIGAITGIVVSLKSAVGLEAALADVRKTTNLTGEELVRLTQNFQEISKEIPITVMELLDMAKVAGQLGITGAKNIEQFSETVAKLAIATDVVGEEGATSLARFLQATGTAMDDMGTEAERVANILNQLENTTAATADEILQMTSYTQGLASQAGMTTDEILAINAALLSLGVKAEAGGSAVVRTMSKIQVAASKGGDELERFAREANMTSEEFRTLVRESPMQALEALAQGMKETADNGGDLNDVLIEMGINEVRERRALLALAQGADTLSRSIENARRESFEMASLNAEVAIQADTVRSKFVLLSNRFVETGQDLGMVLLPVLHILLDVLISLADNMDAVIRLAGALATALGLRGLAGAFTVAATAGTTFLGIVRAFMGPVGLITAGIGLLTTGWQLWSRSQEESVDVTERSADAVEELQNKVDAAISVFSRVRSKNDLLYAMDAVSKYLEGDAAKAWDAYKAKIRENIGEVQDLQAETLKIMEGFVAIQTQAEAAALAVARAAVTSAVQSNPLVSALFGSGALNLGDPEAFKSQIQSMIDSILGTGFSMDAAFDPMAMRIGAGVQRAIAAGIDDAQLVGALREILALTDDITVAQAEYDAAVQASSNSLELLRAIFAEGPGGAAPPPGEGGGEGMMGSIQAIIDRFEQEQATLLYFFEDGGTNIVKGIDDYKEKVVAAGESAMLALVSILKGPDELTDAEITAIYDAIARINSMISNLRTEELQEVENDFEAATDGVERFGDGVLATVSFVERTAGRFESLTGALRALGDAGVTITGPMLEYLMERFGDVNEAAEESVRSFGGLRQYYIDLAGANEKLANGIQVLDTYLSEGLIDSTEYANRKIQLQEQYVRDLTAIYGELHPRVIAAIRDLQDMKQALADNEAAQQDLLDVIEAAEGAEDRWSRAKAAREAQQAAVAKATKDYADELKRLDELLRLGIIDEQQALNGQLKAAEANFYAVAAATGWYSEATEDAANAVKALREEIEKLQALEAFEKWTMPEIPKSETGKGKDGDTKGADFTEGKRFGEYGGKAEGRDFPGKAQPGKPAPGGKEGAGGKDWTITYDLTFMDKLRDTVLGVVASTSELGSAFASSLTPKTDELGNVVGMSFDPMMMLIQVIGKVLGKSEGFATALETLDKVLDPLVDIVDALFGALQPIIEVAVALVQSALKPFVMIIENVVAPVLTALANIIKSVWNALASFLFWLEKIEDDEGGRDSSAKPGSIAYARDMLSKAQDQYNKATTDRMREIWANAIEHWEGIIEQMDVLNPGPEQGSLAWMRNRLSELQELYENAVSDEERQYYLEQIRLQEEEIEATERVAEGIEDVGDDAGDIKAGTNISEITGPTRDLLIDLLTPLSILPSWTSMIQDIRNDVRAIAMGGYGIRPPEFSTAQVATSTTPAMAGTTYNFNNVTITSSASNLQQLARELSKFTFTERRGGK